jgi:trimethylamine--corrinoid protein Co-methyltransferase
VDCPSIAISLRNAGLEGSEQGVFNFKADEVRTALASTPKTITLTLRTGEQAFSLDRNQPKSVFGMGVTNTHYANPVDGVIHPIGIDNIQQAVRLTDRLDNFQLIATPGVLDGEDTRKSELAVALAMLTASSKPLMLLVNEAADYRRVLQLAEELFQRKAGEHSDLLCYVNPITPLVINAETCQKIEISIERGIPLVYSNYGMAGATTPLDPMAGLALLNAELLAGLVLIQTLSPGHPTILGSLPAMFEMSQLRSIYDHRSLWLNLACADMLAHYGLLHCGTSGSGMGYGADLPNAITQTINHLTSLLGSAQLIPFIGGDFDSRVLSMQTVVFVDDLLRQLKAFAEMEIGDFSEQALDEIRAIGIGGSFLTSEQTLAGFRKHLTRSRIWPDISLETWQASGSQNAEQRLRDYTLDLLDEAQATKRETELYRQGEQIIARILEKD